MKNNHYYNNKQALNIKPEFIILITLVHDHFVLFELVKCYTIDCQLVIIRENYHFVIYSILYFTSVVLKIIKNIFDQQIFSNELKWPKWPYIIYIKKKTSDNLNIDFFDLWSLYFHNKKAITLRSKLNINPS